MRILEDSELYGTGKQPFHISGRYQHISTRPLEMSKIQEPQRPDNLGSPPASASAKKEK